MMSDLKEKLIESGCSSEFILDALRYEKLYNGDIDAFIDTVEDILMSDEENDDLYDDDDDIDDEEENVHLSDYNYDGNIYFEDEDEEDEEDEEERRRRRTMKMTKKNVEGDDPIYRSDYNYDGNEDNIYFEEDREDYYSCKGIFDTKNAKCGWQGAKSDLVKSQKYKLGYQCPECGGPAEEEED